jgi:hypothetical protein
LDDYIILYCYQLQLNKIQTKTVFIFVCDFQLLCLLRKGDVVVVIAW